MPTDTLVLSTLASVASAVLYLYIAVVLQRRQVSADARFARNMFALWWAVLGVLGIMGAAQVFLYRAGHLPIWLYLTTTQVALVALFLALWALQVYLVYLYTGTKRWVLPLGVFYVAMYIAIVGLLQWAGRPEEIVDNGWQLRTLPESDLPREFGVVFIVLLLGPAMWAAGAYARLYGKTKDRTQRYRIAMLTTAILVWFGTSAVVGASSTPGEVNVPWQIASKLLALAAAVAILFAYQPPGWIRRKFGIEALAGKSNLPA